MALIAMLALALLPAAVQAAEGNPTMTVMTEHPRVFFIAADVSRLKATGFEPAEQLLTLGEFTLSFGGGVRGTAKRVTFRLPPEQPGQIDEPPGFDAKRYGHFPYWTGMSGRIESYLKSLALSYAVTRRAEFAQRAKEYCLALAGWSAWTDPDYHPNLTPCLDTGHFLIGCAAAYDVCGEAFTPDERTAFVAALQRLGLEPTYRWCSGERQQASEFNLEILLNAALGIAALAVWEELDPADAQRYLSQARSYFLALLDRKLTSPNTEGLAYSSSLDHGSRFADALRRATGDTAYFEHPYLNELLPRWLAYFAGPNHSGGVNFCDAGGYPRPFATTLKLLSNGGHGLAGWLLRYYGIADGGRTWEDALYSRAEREIAPPDEWPSSGLIETIGWAALRSGWAPDDTLLAFKCSSSKEGHDHADQGNFVLNVGGTWLLTDLGYGSFRSAAEGAYSRGTPGHNSVLVDGQGQTQRAGEIVAFHAGERLDWVLGDASRCYDPKLLQTFRRQIVYVKPDYFVIVDELESDDAPRSFQWLLHCDGPEPFAFDGAPLTPPGRRPVSRITVRKERAEADLDVLWPRDAIARYEQWPGTEDNYDPFVLLEAPRPSVRQTFVVAIQPRRVLGEILLNGGFESGARGWSFGGEKGSEVQAGVDDRVAHTGKRSVRLAGEVPERDRSLYGQWYLPAEEGTLYRGSIWCRTEALEGKGPVIDLTFYDDHRQYRPPAGVTYGRTGTHDWEELVIEARAPEGAALMTFRAGLNWCKGTLWFDDARIEALDPPPVAPEVVARTFELVGSPEAGAYGVRMVNGDRQDLLLFNHTGAEATVAGVSFTEPVLLVRTENGRTERIAATDDG